MVANHLLPQMARAALEDVEAAAGPVVVDELVTEAAILALKAAARAAEVAMRGKDDDARLVAEAAVVQLLDSVRADLAKLTACVDHDPGWLAYQAARFVAAARG